MNDFPGLGSIQSLFPTTYWVFETRGLADGVIVRFPQGFYLKFYYSDTQSGMYDIVGGWNGEVSPCLRTTVAEKDMKQWCSQIHSVDSFIRVVYETMGTHT